MLHIPLTACGALFLWPLPSCLFLVLVNSLAPAKVKNFKTMLCLLFPAFQGCVSVVLSMQNSRDKQLLCWKHDFF